MTITQTPRLGLNKWGATSDSWTYLQQNADADAAEAVTAMYVEGTLASRPAAGKHGRFHWASDQAAGAKLSYDNGAVWELVPAVPGGAPTTAAPGDAAAAGSATTWSRSDHRHGMPAWASSAVALDASGGSAGSALTVARGDHKHALPGTVAYTDGATVNFTGDLQAGGQSIARGRVALDTSSTTGAQVGGTEVMDATLTSTFTSLAGHAYLIVFTYGHSEASSSGDFFFLRLRDGTTTGSPQIDVWGELSLGILGITNSRTIHWAPAAGTHTVCPSIQRGGTSGTAGFVGARQLVVVDIGT